MQQVRVYTVTEKEIERSPDMIAGKAHINGKLAHILINPGATFLFISSTFMMHDRLKMDYLNEFVIVSIPIGMSVVCKNLCRNI